jgi:hypothetical protein
MYDMLMITEGKGFNFVKEITGIIIDETSR